MIISERDKLSVTFRLKSMLRMLINTYKASLMNTVLFMFGEAQLIGMIEKSANNMLHILLEIDVAVTSELAFSGNVLMNYVPMVS